MGVSINLRARTLSFQARTLVFFSPLASTLCSTSTTLETKMQPAEYLNYGLNLVFGPCQVQYWELILHQPVNTAISCRPWPVERLYVHVVHV